ncbi:MAG: LytTR family DNA-binding domain-containing protein [Arcicella sp.]|nr:LytTR family DNA-binding domain-containing protein [Arcicella sp.]
MMESTKPKISCVFIEDDNHGIELLRTYASLNPFLEVKGFFTNPLEALAYLSENPIDLLFTDVQMPDITGIDLIKCLRYKPYVILITAEPSHAVTGYDLDIVDFLLKPVSLDRFIKSVNKVLDKIDTKAFLPKEKDILFDDEIEYSISSIYVKEGGKIIRVDFDEIVAIEGLKDYVKIITDSGTIITHLTMKKLEEQVLPKSSFMRIHKSYIVSLFQIRKYDHIGGLLELRNKLEIPVGPQYKEELIGRIKPIN